MIKKIILNEKPNWYFKAIGMLQHNYAFIHHETDDKYIVYFCHERGMPLNGLPSHIDSKAFFKEDLPCIVDSLEFSDLFIAQFSLEKNHFRLISEEGPDSNFDLDGCPDGKEFFDLREYEPGIYSKQDKYWIHIW